MSRSFLLAAPAACIGAAVLLVAAPTSGASPAAGLAITTASATRPARTGDQLSELKVKLRDRDKWIRQDAVEKLAKVDSTDAWELVIDALGDPKGEVADTAQHLLAGIHGEKELKLLAGKHGLRSKNEWVRLRAAEVFGRLEVQVDGGELRRALSDRDPELRLAVLWSCERLLAADRLGGEPAGLAKSVDSLAARDRDPRVRAAAFGLLAAIDPDGARERLPDFVGSREVALRCAAAAALPTLGGAGAEGLLSRLAADESPVVRTRAVLSLGELRTRSATLALIERLEQETELRLSWRIVDQLQALTGLRHRRDPRPWRAFAGRMAQDWVPAAVTEAADDQDERGDASVAFAGLPILSERVVFLIDLSGSIWKERADGKTRKQVVERELATALRSLPPETRFNLVPFTAEPLPWQKSLVQATPTNVKKAIAFFEDCNAQGTGNFWDAAILALAEYEVDTIVVLTDGAPTGGQRHRLELIVPLFLLENRDHQVTLDAILVGASRRLREHWGRLAESTGGRMVRFDL